LLAIAMPRLTRLLLLIGSAVLIAAPVAQARTAPTRTLRFRVPVPAAGNVSILSVELSIGGEGKHHRKQVLSLEMLNHKEPGVFGLGRLQPEHGHAGRFLAVVEVFHRRSAATAALPSGFTALAQAPPFGSAHLATASDEFQVRARNERVIKKVLKENIDELAEEHKLRLDEFCEPQSIGTYLLGSAVLGAAYVLAGRVTELPTNTSISKLADDAIFELCDEEEDGEEGSFEEDDEEEYGGIAIFEEYLGIAQQVAYRVGLSGAWIFEGPNEVKFMGMLIGARFTPYAHGADSRHPVDALKLVLAPAGTTPRAVTNHICPTQLPTAAITTTKNANDTLMCSGGSLPLDQQFSLNVQTSPPPSSGMGGQLIAHQDGAYLAPLSFGGP
jgi:hypothetical protein